MSNNNKKIAVAMSGGVDSSVAAIILKNQGYDVTGFFMHFWHEPGENKDLPQKNKCCSLDSYESARRTAELYSFPIYTINASKEFKNRVVDYFVDSYSNGQTPNPCIACNKFIKFGLLIDKISELGFNYLATGHHVKIKKEKTGFKLIKGKDSIKDQSYFLYNLTQRKLAKLKMPIGQYTKAEIRQLAKKSNIPSFTRPESQGICFIKQGKHNDFLQKYLPELKPGSIVDSSGKVLAKHDGLPLYTIGQRKGIEIGGIGPYYVTKINYSNNELVVSNNPTDPNLYSNSLQASNINWTSSKPKIPYDCTIKVRYMKKSVPAVITQISPNLQIKFKEKIRAVMPGQSVVIYDKEEVIGGGIINSTS